MKRFYTNKTTKPKQKNGLLPPSFYRGREGVKEEGWGDVGVHVKCFWFSLQRPMWLPSAWLLFVRPSQLLVCALCGCLAPLFLAAHVRPLWLPSACLLSVRPPRLP